jgi:tetratricopeptide (TPR) repeat protein
MDARGYHFTSVCLHAGGAVAFFFLARRLLPLCAPDLGGRALDFAAVSAALLFAVHPLRVESVAWVTERRDVLSGVFFVLTILVYVRSRTSTDERARRRDFMLALALLCASLLAKASGMTMPLVLCVIDRWPLRRTGAGVLLEKTPFALLVLPFAALALWAQSQQPHVLATIANHGVIERIAHVAYSVVFYPMKTLAPTHLGAMYDLPVPFETFSLRFMSAIVCAVGLSACLFALRHKAPAAWTAWAVFLVLVAPTSGVAQAGPQLVADRYGYFSCMPFALLAAGSLFAYVPRGQLAISAGLVGVLGTLCWRQTRTWHDSLSLYEHAISANPSSYIAHENLGFVLLASGRVQEAIDQQTRAIEINPRLANAHDGLGQALVKQGQLEKAAAHFRSALAIEPDFALAHIHLGMVTAQQGDAATAEAELRAGVELAPANATAHALLGNLLLSQRRIPDALVEYLAAAQHNPDDPDTRMRAAKVLALSGRARAAVVHFRAALRAKPHWPEVEIDLAWILATHEDPSVRNADEAVVLAEDAMTQLSAPAARDLDTLGAAYAAAGRFGRARASAQRALQVSLDPDLSAAIRGRLELYTAERAFVSDH